MEENLRKFILDHAADDTDRLLLGSSRWPDIDVPTAVNCILSRRKMRGKVKEWYDCDSLLYPNTISAEQCSSSATARFKAGVVLAAAPDSSAIPASAAHTALSTANSHQNADCCTTFPSNSHRDADCWLNQQSVADLTGGLGVDSWAFAKAGARVLYNEMNPSIHACALHNFAELGLRVSEIQSPDVDIVCRNFELRADNIDEILDGFRPDTIFLDPARRSQSGGKVIRLEDCSPNLLEVAMPLLEHSPRIVAKVSPMADISLICRQLADMGAHVCNVRIVGCERECKELLLVIMKASESRETEDLNITVAECNDSLHQPEATFSFAQSDERNASPVLIPCPKVMTGMMLFEPGKALMKSGAYNLLCSKGLYKSGLSTHLYVSTDGTEFPEQLLPLGKLYSIKEVHQLDKHTIKAVGKAYPHSEVTARNIPMSSDELRKRLGVTSGDDAHIFGVRCDFTDAPSGNLLLVCERH